MKFFCLAFTLFTIAAFGQNDTLLAALQKLKPGIEYVDVLNSLCAQYRDKDNNLALKYAKRAARMADSLNYRTGSALALENTGWILYRMGDYTQSLTLSLEAMRHNEIIGDSLALARCYNNIGAIGFEDENYDQAIQYFKKGVVIATTLNDSATASRSMNNLSLAYYRIKKIDSAEYFAKQALLVDALKTFRSAFAYRMLSDLAIESQDYEQAFTHLQKSLEISMKTQNTFLITSVQVRLGKMYLAQKKYKQAESIFKKNAALAESLRYKNELEQSFDGLAETYKAIGNYKEALTYKSRYIELHDSLRSESYRERLASLQSSHDAELQESEIKLLNQQNLLNEQTIKNQRIQNYVYAASSLVLLISFIFLMRANRKIRNANEELAAKKVEIENQARQLTDLNHNKDKLFQLLSHDLRTPVGNVKNVFDMLTAGHITHEEFKTLSMELKPALNNLYLDLNNLLHWSKSQLSGTQASPNQFEVGPLINELVVRARELSHQKNVVIISEVVPGVTVFVDRDHLTSIIRNLLSNALKFSNDGGRIWVTASLQDEKVKISVKDEGVGLSREELEKITSHLLFTRPGTHREKGTGIGLTIINEFVKANHGQLDVTSQPAAGSTFTVIFPSSRASVN